MQKIKKLIATLVLVAMTGSFASQAHADQACDPVCYDNNDCCYEDCRASTYAVPVALGAVAVIAIIAIACQNNGHHHGHSHSHGL